MSSSGASQEKRDRPRIAFVDPGSFTLPYDRAYISRIASEFAVDFYCSQTKYNEEEIDRTRLVPGVKVLTYSISGSVSHRLGGIKEYLRLVIDLYRHRHRYVAIHFNWPLLAQTDQFLLPFLFGRKLVLTIHNAAPHGYQGAHQPTRRLAAGARAVIFPSAATRKQFIELYGTPGGTSAVLAHGTLAFGDPCAAGSYVRHHVQESIQRRLIFFGNVKPYKGIETLAAASHLLARKGIQVAVYGKWDKSLVHLQSQFSPTSTIVDKFLSQSESIELFNSTGVFCLPYESASQSGVLYNLLHYATPFISSSVGDTKDFLETYGMPELLFDPGNSRELCLAAERAFENQTKIANQLEAARILHSWSYSSEDLIEVYTDSTSIRGQASLWR